MWDYVVAPNGLLHHASTRLLDEDDVLTILSLPRLTKAQRVMLLEMTTSSAVQYSTVRTVRTVVIHCFVVEEYSICYSC